MTVFCGLLLSETGLLWTLIPRKKLGTKTEAGKVHRTKVIEDMRREVTENHRRKEGQD